MYKQLNFKPLNSLSYKAKESKFCCSCPLNTLTLSWQAGQQCCIAHSIICTRLFSGKMHSDWFNGIETLQGRWQHGEKVGYCYPSGLEKTLCKWFAQQHCTQYHLYTVVSRENAFWLFQRNRDTSRWRKVRYCYPSELEKTPCKWDIYAPLVTKGLKNQSHQQLT